MLKQSRLSRCRNSEGTRDFERPDGGEQEPRRYVVTPIYKYYTAAPKSEVFEASMVLGRRELATIWWKHCPNQCQAHLRSKRPVCRQFCKPLCTNVGLLSRKLIHLRKNALEIHENCRFPYLVNILPDHTTQSTSLGRTSTSNYDPLIPVLMHDVTIGDSDKTWMKFCIAIEASPQQSTDGDDRRDEASNEDTVSRRKALQSEGSDTLLSASFGIKRPMKISLTDTGQSEQENKQIDDKKPCAVTPATRKRRHLSESQDSSSSESCKRRLFNTQAQTKIDDSPIPPESGMRPLRLWPNLSSNNTPPQASFLSLPMPQEDSQLSNSSMGSSLQEATQIQWPSQDGKVKERKCADLSLSEWKSMQNGKGIFCSTMAKLIVARNSAKSISNTESDDRVCIPSLIAMAKIK